MTTRKSSTAAKKAKTRSPVMSKDLEIQWKNFRGFQDTGRIAFRPLTILIGPNNVGKTSLVAPLLLLNQTMSSRDLRTPIVTRGDIVDFGIFRDIIHQKDSMNDIDLTFRFRFHARTFRPARRPGGVGGYAPGLLRVKFGQAKHPEDAVLKEFHIHDMYGRVYISRILQRDGSYSLTGISSDFTTQELSAIKRSRPTNFLFSPTNAIDRYNDSESELENSNDPISKKAFSADFSHFLQVIGFTFEKVRSFLLSTTYIGPLRAKPLRHYQVEGETLSSVGPQGERMANLLRQRARNVNFKKKVDKWVKKFEFGDRIELKNELYDVFSVSFKKKGIRKAINIADTGFGASQVLPLIVQSLSARPGTLTIAEQPEIHLNPRLQTILADLFVEMANERKRVIVETHSEHLLLRLRRLVAEGVIPSEDVAIFFIENGDSGSVVREIPLSTDGHIEFDDWPKGFFAETLKESLALASAQAVRSE